MLLGVVCTNASIHRLLALNPHTAHLGIFYFLFLISKFFFYSILQKRKRDLEVLSDLPEAAPVTGARVGIQIPVQVAPKLWFLALSRAALPPTVSILWSCLWLLKQGRGSIDSLITSRNTWDRALKYFSAVCMTMNDQLRTTSIEFGVPNKF